VETSLLATKLYIPPARPGLVPRQRLIEQLQAGLSCNLMLVSAPAGFGKTTILSEWVRCSQPQIGAAWVSLDEGENDPVRFWDYFVAALKTLQTAIGDNFLALLHSPQPPPSESVLMTLINDIVAIPYDFIVVLDDYHFIKSQNIHAGIAFLLDHSPPRMHLVIATRADPPLPLAHFRGRGLMLEMGADDLRFTLDEAASLLKEMESPELSAEDVSALNARTEGWAVGLKMAALSMRKQKDTPRFIAIFTGSQRYIMDYLIEEVLQQQSKDVQDFLLKTSVLERLTASLCDAVTGRTDSQTMLLNLEQANLFIVPLDESREWYRYEHLFAELLHHQLEMSSGTRAVMELHQQASQWYQDNGFLNDAINHALAAQDWEMAMSLIYDMSERQKKTGEMVTLLNWLQAVPEEMLRTHPRLYLNYSVALLFTGQLDAAEAIWRYLEPVAKEDTAVLGKITACQALVAIFRRDTPRDIELSKKALPLLSPDDLDIRGSLSLNLGMIQWEKGQLKEAEPLLREAYEIGRQIGHYWIASMALSFLSDFSQLRGKLHQAAELCQQAIELAAQSPAAACPHFFLSTVLYEWNDLQSTVFYLEKALELNRLLGHPGMQEVIYWYLMRTRLAQGDEAGALEAIEEIDQLVMNDSSPASRARQAGYHLQLALAQDDLDQVLQWGNRVSEYGDAVPFYLRHLLMPLLIARGQKDAVPSQIRTFYESVQTEWLFSEWQYWFIVARVYQALSAPTPDEALFFLSEALATAQPEGYIRTFVDEGKLLAPLLRKAVSRGIEPEYAGKLLTIIEAEKRRKGTLLHPSSTLLSERELEVLRLLAAGLSNQQIADKLIINLSTAKSHVHNILEKLNTKNRTQAIARARELKLM
jgi:LuxR family maltose regulon positive regulatory protein